jgi:hypothetical protein
MSIVMLPQMTMVAMVMALMTVMPCWVVRLPGPGPGRARLVPCMWLTAHPDIGSVFVCVCVCVCDKERVVGSLKKQTNSIAHRLIEWCTILGLCRMTIYFSRSFFNAVFSWLFGDGHPQPEFASEQWAAMGEYVKAWGGGGGVE